MQNQICDSSLHLKTLLVHFAFTVTRVAFKKEFVGDITVFGNDSLFTFLMIKYNDDTEAIQKNNISLPQSNETENMTNIMQPIMLDIDYKPNGSECDNILMKVYRNGRSINYPYQIQYYSQHACEISMNATPKLEGRIKINAFYKNNLIQSFQFKVILVQDFKNAGFIISLFVFIILVCAVFGFFYLSKSLQLSTLMHAFSIQKQHYHPKDKKIITKLRKEKRLVLMESQNRNDPFLKYDSKRKMQPNIKLKIPRHDILFQLRQLELNKHVISYAVFDKKNLIERKQFYKYLDTLQSSSIITVKVQKIDKRKYSPDDRIFSYEDLIRIPLGYKIKVRDPIRKKIAIRSLEFQKCLDHLKLEQQLQCDINDYYTELHGNIVDSIKQRHQQQNQPDDDNDIFTAVEQKLFQEGAISTVQIPPEDENRNSTDKPNLLAETQKFATLKLDIDKSENKTDYSTAQMILSRDTNPSTDFFKKTLQDNSKQSLTQLLSQGGSNSFNFGFGIVQGTNSIFPNVAGSTEASISKQIQGFDFKPQIPNLSLENEDLLRPTGNLGLIHTIHESSTCNDMKIQDALQEPGAMELDLLLNESENDTQTTVQGKTSSQAQWISSDPFSNVNSIVPFPSLINAGKHQSNDLQFNEHQSQISGISMIDKGLSKYASSTSISTTSVMPTVFGGKDIEPIFPKKGLDKIHEDEQERNWSTLNTQRYTESLEMFDLGGSDNVHNRQSNTKSQTLNNISSTSGQFAQSNKEMFNLYDQLYEFTKDIDSSINITRKPTEGTDHTQQTSHGSISKKESYENLGTIDFMMEFHQQANQQDPQMSSAINSRRQSITEFQNIPDIDAVESDNQLIPSLPVSDIVSGVDMEVDTKGDQTNNEPGNIGPQVVRAFGDEIVEKKKKNTRKIEFTNTKLIPLGSNNQDNSGFSFQEDLDKVRNIESAKVKLLSNYDKLQKINMLSGSIKQKYALNMFLQKGCYFQRFQISIIVANVLYRKSPGSLFFNYNFVVVIKKPTPDNILWKNQLQSENDYLNMGIRVEFGAITTKEFDLKKKVPGFINYKFKRLQTILMVLMMSEITFGKRFTLETLLLFLQDNLSDEIYKPYCLVMGFMLIFQSPKHALSMLQSFLPEIGDNQNVEQDGDISN